MKINFKSSFGLICLLALLAFSSCMSSNLNSHETVDEEIQIPTTIASSTSELDNPTVTVEEPTQIQPTNTSSPTHIPTPTIISSPITGPLPDIIANIGTATLPECLWEGKSQIWKFIYPYEEPEILLQDPEKHYFFPMYSNDGTWISYVESIPTWGIDGTPKPEDMGTDSIWIMRPDGTEKQKISIDFNRFDYKYGNNCTMGYRIAESPIWTPNDDYLYFAYFDTRVHNYLLDIITGELITLPINTFSSPVWLSDHEALFIINSEVVIIDFSSPTDLQVINYPGPTEYPGANIDSFPALINENSILVSSYNRSQNAFEDLYAFDLSSQTWEMVLETSKWVRPLAGEFFSVACDYQTYDQLIFRENITLKGVGYTYLPKEINYSYCTTITKLQVYQGPYGEDLIMFVDDGYFWTARMQPGSYELTQLLNIRTFTSFYYGDVISYTLRP